MSSVASISSASTRYDSPFTRAYWRAAVRSLSDVRMLTLAAMVVALRVVLRAVSIPVGESLYVSVAFLPNALGAMLYGPVLAFLSGAASDILGYLVSPRGGAFYPPFTLVEMLGSLLFALFLYRAPLRVWRAALAKLSVNVVCNIILTPILLSSMYGKAISVYFLPRVAKNLCLFPLEASLLCLFLGAALPALKRLGFCDASMDIPRLGRRHVFLFIGMAAASALCVAAYYILN